MQGAETEGLAARRRTVGYVEDVRPEVQAHGAKFARPVPPLTRLLFSPGMLC